MKSWQLLEDWENWKTLEWVNSGPESQMTHATSHMCIFYSYMCILTGKWGNVEYRGLKEAHVKGKGLWESNEAGARIDVIWNWKGYTRVGEANGGEGGAGRFGRKRRERDESPLNKVVWQCHKETYCFVS